jgi:acetyltransferase-like isoleucine patch superfamily enzyme
MRYSLIEKILSRPGQIWPNIRGRWLFIRTNWILSMTSKFQKTIHRGKNVRQQRLRCVYTTSDISRVHIGDHSIIYEDAVVAAIDSGIITIGNNSIVGRTQIFSRSKVELGKNLVTSWNVLIQDYDSHPTESALRAAQIESMTLNFWPHFDSLDDIEKKKIASYTEEIKSWTPPTDPISIGENVWIGANTCILKGAKIGNHCIIASNSVVTKGIFEDNSLVAGNPAKFIKKLN